ncbi:MAG: DUF2752 domain-containing protein [Bacteroidota bacterium]
MIKYLHKGLNDRSFKRFYSFVMAIGFPVAFIILLVLPADYFNTGQSVCLSVVLFDTTCYGCGMTRAIMHIIHFDFATAWEFNPLAFLVFPLASYVLFKKWWDSIRAFKK